MARPREFNAEELLDKAMLAFLQSGFQSTSMRHLEDLTGVKQVSIYNAYGNKENLFLAAFDRYTELISVVQNRYMDDRGLDGIVAFMKAIASPESPIPLPHFGCLIVNTALVAEAAGPKIQSRVQDYRQQMHSRFVAAFSRAKSRQKLSLGLNLDHCAELVISALWGIFVTIRLANDDQTAGQPAVEALVKTLRNWGSC